MIIIAVVLIGWALIAATGSGKVEKKVREETGSDAVGSGCGWLVFILLVVLGTPLFMMVVVAMMGGG